jgi:glycine cleavage system H protein
MSKVYFTEDHEWVRLSGDEGVVGITEYAAQALGDVVFVEPPALGRVLAKGEEAAVVESVKAASDIYAPVAGEVVTVNGAIVDQPGLVNDSPEDAGWFFTVRLSDRSQLDGLMDRAAYDAFLKTLE